MAPGLTEEVPLSPAKVGNSTNGMTHAATEGVNGKHANVDESAAPAPSKKGRYNAIPGPLGLASASLEGKVALVTGAGMFDFSIVDPFSTL